MTKTRYEKRECSRCHEIKKCRYIPDPHNSEIYDDYTPMWLCDYCCELSGDEI